MSEGRAPWPTFRADARAALARSLAPLGLVFDPKADEGAAAPRDGHVRATFFGPGGQVELAYDPWDVDLAVRVNGVWLALLLAQLLPGGEKPPASKKGLTTLGALLAELLPKLSSPKGRRALRESSAWQAILSGSDPVAMRRMLEGGAPAALRAAAAQRLGSMEPPTAIMARSLARALGDKDLAVRLAAAEALYHRGASAPAVAVAALSRALGDAHEALRIQALLALRQLGRRAGGALPAVQERWRRGGARERRVAAEVVVALASKNER